MKMKLKDVNQTMTCDIQFSRFFELWQNAKSLTIYDAFVNKNMWRQQKNHTNICKWFSSSKYSDKI